MKTPLGEVDEKAPVRKPSENVLTTPSNAELSISEPDKLATASSAKASPLSADMVVSSSGRAVLPP